MFARGLVRVRRDMAREYIVYAVAATVILLVIAILLVALLFQRRRQRVMLMMSLAQEEANRRRRRRKKSGLRRWEIDMVCPEALVARISATVSRPVLHSQKDHPHQYATSLETLRAANLLPKAAMFLSEEDDNLITPPAVVASHIYDRELNRTSPTTIPESAPVGTSSKPLIPLHVAILPPAFETCVICMDAIDLGERIRVLPCAHFYHGQCIRMWLRRKNACPCCSEKVIKRRSTKRDRLSTHTTIDGPPAHILVPLDTPSLTNVGSDHSASPNITSPRVRDTQTESSFSSSHPRIAERYSMQPANRNRPVKPMFPTFNLPPNPHTPDPVDDHNLDAAASEASSQGGDETTAAELLFQTRYLPSDNSMLSLNASTTDLSDAPLSDYPNLRMESPFIDSRFNIVSPINPSRPSDTKALQG